MVATEINEEPGVSKGTPPADRKGRSPIAMATGWSWLTYAVLIIGVVIFIMPFLVMVSGSLKSQGELLRNPTGLIPQNPTLENYVAWFVELNFQRFFFNSLVVALFVVAGNIAFCSMVGYALAKLDFAGKRVLFVIVMITLMTPVTVTFVPLFVLVSRLGLVNTLPGLFLPFLVTPLGVFLMRQFIMGIPDALLEAARIDGASEFGIFGRIVMPLCGAPIATLSILTFLSSWNNFLWPLVASQSETAYTLPIALTLYSRVQDMTNYGLMLAGAVLVIVPIVILFLFLQRYFVQSVVGAGVK